MSIKNLITLSGTYLRPTPSGGPWPQPFLIWVAESPLQILFWRSVSTGRQQLEVFKSPLEEARRNTWNRNLGYLS